MRELQATPTVMGVAEMSGLFTLTDHEFAHSLAQKVVLVGSPARLHHVVRHLAGDLVLPAIALGVLDGLFSGIKMQLHGNMRQNKSRLLQQ